MQLCVMEPCSGFFFFFLIFVLLIIIIIFYQSLTNGPVLSGVLIRLLQQPWGSVKTVASEPARPAEPGSQHPPKEGLRGITGGARLGLPPRRSSNPESSPGAVPYCVRGCEGRAVKAWRLKPHCVRGCGQEHGKLLGTHCLDGKMGSSEVTGEI